MNKTKISNFQLFALTANYSLGTAVIATSSGIAELAKQDAWICALITPVIGLPFIWMYCYLGKLYPGKTFVDMFSLVFGKWLGWIISAFFVLFICFLSAAAVISYIGNFVQTEYMSETPLYALNLLFAIVLVIGLLYGLEAIARSAEVFIYIVTVLFVLTMLMSVPNIHPENLLPVFEKGMVPILKGTIRLSSFLTWPFIVLIMIYPINTGHTVKTRNALFWGYLWASTINFVCTIMAILVLGSTITARSQYPTYLMAEEISIGIIDRIEALVSFSWILTESVRMILYFYAGVIGLSQLFGLKDHKKIVLPLGLAMLVYSGVVYPDAAYQAKWDSTTWIALIGTFGIVLPIVMLIISIIKKKRKAVH